MRGQADAVKLGIARALMQFNAELRGKLKSEGMVSRDSRGKERKKYGQKGARKRFQFSKRSTELRVPGTEQTGILASRNDDRFWMAGFFTALTAGRWQLF